MDLNKFTEKSQAALMEAQNIATRNQHQAVDVEHLLLALLEQEGGLVPRLFEKAKVAPDLLKAKVEEELNRIPRVSGSDTTGQGTYVTQRLNKCSFRPGPGQKNSRTNTFRRASRAGMFAEPTGTGIGKSQKPRLRREDFLKASPRCAASTRHQRQPEATDAALEKYGRDLTRLAAQNQLIPTSAAE